MLLWMFNSLIEKDSSIIEREKKKDKNPSWIFQYYYFVNFLAVAF